MVYVPVLDLHADGARADEHRHLDPDADLLGDAVDRLDVLDQGAGGAVGQDVDLLVADLQGEALGRLLHVRPGAG